MASLIQSLSSLRTELNRLDPNRPKESDGWIGDAAHQAEKSDHNQDSRGLVHAIDVTAVWWLEIVIQFLLVRCRAGLEKRLTYIIYKRRIWSASHGWVEREYTGASPHMEHAHFSGSAIPSLENNTSDWHIGETVMTPAQMKELKDYISNEIRAVVDDRKRDYAEAVGQVAVDRINPQPGQTAKVTYGSIWQWQEENLRKLGDRIIAALKPDAVK